MLKIYDELSFVWANLKSFYFNENLPNNKFYIGINMYKMSIKQIKTFVKQIGLLGNKVGINLFYLILIPLVCIGFNDFPYIIRLHISNIAYIKYAVYLISMLTFYSLIFSNKRTGNFIFMIAIYNVIYSIYLAVISDYSSSLYLFVTGFVLLVKYLYEFYLLGNEFNTEIDKFTIRNIQTNSLMMLIVFILTKLSLLFSKYFLNTFLTCYYLSLKQSNSFTSVFLFMFIQYKFYISLLIFLVFMMFIVYNRDNPA